MDLALTLSFILAIGTAAQWLAWYLKQPSILLLLLAGIVIGPVLGIFNPDEALGDLLFPFISLGVAIILFEGAMTLEFHEIKNHGRVVTRIVTLGVIITIGIISVASYYLFDMDKRIALLFGTLVCVTGPTVIVPILRSVRPNSNISNILRWEGILIDPIGALLVVLVYQYIVSGHQGESLLTFVKTFAVGIGIGLTSGVALVFLIKKHLVPEYLQNIFTLSFVLIMFSISNHIKHESGLLTVTIMGMVLANWPKFPKKEILHFKESLSIMLISTLFIILAARVELGGFKLMGYKGIIILLIIMFVARPLSVFASSWGSKLKLEEKLMISWIAPRGIVAAAISSLFIIKLEHYNLKGSEILVPLVFTIIIGTVFIQSLGAKFIAKSLKVSEPSANGVIIAGGTDLSLAIAKTLFENNINVIVANNSFTEIKKARMLGIKTYFGNPVSEHADRYLDLIGIGCLFAMSQRSEVNTLTALKYKYEFGSKNIYRLKVGDSKPMTAKEKTHTHWQTPWLFSEKTTFTKLNSLLKKGATIKTTNITPDYDFTEYEEDNTLNKGMFIPMFLIDEDKELVVFSSEKQPKIENGTKLISLVYEGESVG